MQKALRSGEVPVRGNNIHRAVTSLLPERIDKTITLDMRIDVLSSVIYSDWRRPLWTEVEIEWERLHIYCEGNLFPPEIRIGLPLQSGRKTESETRTQQILDAFERMTVTGKHGEQAAIARKLNKKFKTYKSDTIRKIIQPMYREKVAKLKKPR